jgi:hypothetical protein
MKIETKKKIKRNIKTKIIFNQNKDLFQSILFLFNLKPFLENFEYEYIRKNNLSNDVFEKKQEIWDNWQNLFVEHLNKYPENLFTMNTPDVIYTIYKYMEYAKSKEKIIEVAYSLFNLLERSTKTTKVNEWGLNIAEYMMQTTEHDSKIRIKLFNKLLKAKSTSFITLNIHTLIKYWEYLSTEEIEKIKQLLISNRKDIKWIQAVALTEEIIPIEIQKILLNETIEDKPISKAVDILKEKDLLKHCISIFSAHRLELVHLDFQHKNKKFWDKIIYEILKRNTINSTYKIALKETVNMLFLYSKEEIPHLYELYENKLLKSKEKRKLIYESSLNPRIDEYSQENHDIMKTLYQNSTKEEIEYFNNYKRKYKQNKIKKKKL